MYTYVDGMEEKRAPYRTAHLDLLKSMTDDGTCLLGKVAEEACALAHAFHALMAEKDDNPSPLEYAVNWFLTPPNGSERGHA